MVLQSLLGDMGMPDYQGSGPSNEEQRDLYAREDRRELGSENALKGAQEEGEKAFNVGGRADLDQNSISLNAIQNRAKQRFGQGMSLRRSMGAIEDIDELNQNRAEKMQFQSQVNKLIKHVQSRRAQAEANKVAARNQVLSSILGAAGAVGGFALGGGFGAAAGGMAGSKLAGNTQTTPGPQYQGSLGVDTNFQPNQQFMTNYNKTFGGGE